MDVLLEFGLPLTLTVILIALNALYVFHEFAYVSITPSQLRRIESSESRLSKMVANGVNNLDHYIAVDQLGITATSIAVGWIGQPALSRLFGLQLEAIGLSSGVMIAAISVFTFLLITGVQMVMGELVPKTVALRKPEQVAFAVAIPIELTAKLLHPLVTVLNGLGMATVRLLGFSSDDEGHRSQLSSEEISAIVDRSVRAGVIKANPRALRIALHFSEVESKDIMIPRHSIIGIELDSSLDEVQAVGRTYKHARYPVYKQSIDNIVGLLNVKELVQISESGDAEVVQDWRALVRPIPALPSTASVEQLLLELRRTRQEMALLINEYGQTDGIVTVSAVARHAVGDTGDIRRVRPGRYMVRAQLGLTALDTALGLSLDDDYPGVATVGGLIMEELGRIPAPGDLIETGNVRLQVVRMEGRRIDQVLLQFHSSAHHPAETTPNV